jgi:predicted kinase
MLHGCPGSGKSTLARVLSELLRVDGAPHAVIELDDLSQIHPSPGRSFARDNLAAVWPNYAAVPGIRVVLCGVLADEQERVRLRAAVATARFVVCELTAPEAVLRKRVLEREPNEYWQCHVARFVNLFCSRTDLARIRDFLVETDGRSPADAAREILEKAGWTAPPTPFHTETADLGTPALSLERALQLAADLEDDEPVRRPDREK